MQQKLQVLIYLRPNLFDDGFQLFNKHHWRTVLYGSVWVQPCAAFSMNWTIAAVFIVIIGGISTVSGPIDGAVVYVLLNQFLSQLGGISMAILGVVAVVVILFAPKGIMGTLQSKFNFEILSARRHSDRTFTGKKLPDVVE